MNYLGPTEQGRKRAVRLQKNREAARECRRKKKEYIKCLENRVAVLEVSLIWREKENVLFCPKHRLRTPEQGFFQKYPICLANWAEGQIVGYFDFILSKNIFSLCVRDFTLINHCFLQKTKRFKHFKGIYIWVWDIILAVEN